MASRELIVKRIGRGKVIVYWSDSADKLMWWGDEDHFRTVLEAYKDADYSNKNLDKLFGFPVVYK